MANVVNRPFHFYASLILLVSPLYLLSIPAMIRERGVRRRGFSMRGEKGGEFTTPRGG